MNYEIVIATTNQHKVDEYRAILGKHGITLYSFKDLNISLPDVEENGKTFEENAVIKAIAASRLVKFPVIADDSGLCVHALNDFPGIRTARFAKECGNQIEANRQLVNKLNNLDRSASFHCVIALCNVRKKPLIFEGIAEGSIAKEYHDELSFGYDPIFISKEKNISFHNLDKKIKNEISHRALACKKLLTMLRLYNYINK